MTAIRGLICRLALPADLEAMDWAALIPRLAPHVDALLLDPGAWRTSVSGEVSTAVITALERILPHLPRPLALLCHISGATGDDTGANLERLEAYRSSHGLGAGLSWVDLPLSYHSNRGLPGFYRELRRLTEQPIVVENDPDRVRRIKAFGRRANIRTQIVKTLVREGNVNALIQHGDLGRALNYSRAIAAQRDFVLLDSDERHFLDYPSTSGLVSISSNVAPQAWGWLVRRAPFGASRATPADPYRSLRFLAELTEALAADPPAGVLHLLHRAGILRRPPSLPPAHAAALDRLAAEPAGLETTCTAS